MTVNYTQSYREANYFMMFTLVWMRTCLVLISR